MKHLSLAILVLLNTVFSFSQPVSLSNTYKDLQLSLAKGWNTWNTESMLSHVLMPEAIAVNVCLNNTANGTSYLKETFNVKEGRPEKITPGWHSSDGKYTELTVEWNSNTFKIQTASKGDQWVALITTIKTTSMVPNIIIEAGLLWNYPGRLSLSGKQIIAEANNKTLVIGSPNNLVDDYVPSGTPYLAIPLSGEIGVYAGSPMSLEDIHSFVESNRNAMEREAMQYESLSELYRTMSSVLGWNTIYDPQNKRVITPASRSWNSNWGGWVLFDWDTYFASYMFSLINSDLAYANAVEITKSITAGGFIPNFAASYGKSSIDRSQPPVGSFVVKEIYKQHGDEWFLRETYDELLTWNRWWPKNRDNEGYLSWGSNPVSDPRYPWQANNLQAAAYESGLDNSPVYDNVPFNKNKHVMELADVGLLSLYIWDCQNLAEIADLLGKKDDAKELKGRAESYGKALKTLWSEEKGIFLNKRTDTGSFSETLSPANFYPLLTGIPTTEQATRMVKEHFLNPNEFYSEWIMPSVSRNHPAFSDQNYWRGRIWAPMNFLVYVGLSNYNLPDARKDLVKKSYNLLMQNWMEKNGVYENYNAITGYADDVSNSDPYYHWGALLGIMSFIEDSYIPAPSTRFFLKRK
ncbi:MAG TPA: trehalase family glycosidase [Bacteroidales bacterium]|nr:trehalase family glycosidase [Bacteroidales bacterium]